MRTVEEAVSQERASITVNTLKLSEFLYGKKEYEEMKTTL